MTKLRYYDDGPRTAPVLVLGCSLGTTAASWEPLLPTLTQDLRVIRYELWGHGGNPTYKGVSARELPEQVGLELELGSSSGHRTRAPSVGIATLGAQVLTVLDDLGVSKAHFAGVSLGGMVALWIAGTHPERVERLGLICTSARLVNRSAYAQRAAQVREQGMVAASAAIERWCTPGWAQRQPAQAGHLRSAFSGIDPAGYAACCDAIAGWDGLDLLENITAPTLVISADQDVAISPTHGRLLAESIAGAKECSLTGCGHVPIFEQPDAVAFALLAHLESGAGLELASGAFGQLTLDELRTRGEVVRRAVLGDAHVDRAQAGATAFTAPFQDLVQWYPWGAIWTRDGLARKERSMITLALLAALHHDNEFVMHVRAARRNGLTAEQIQEVILHIGVYAGIPVANHAFGLAKQALAEDA